MDQNKWIEFSRVVAGKVTKGITFELFNQLSRAVKEKRVVFPLTFAHIIETSKRDEAISRGYVAQAQAILSCGRAYRSYSSRLHVEINHILHKFFGHVPPEMSKNWAIADSFLELLPQMDLFCTEKVKSTNQVNFLIDSQSFYYKYIKYQDDSRRREACTRLNADNAWLISELESKRALFKGENIEFRRRGHWAQLFINNLDKIIQVTNDLGYTYEQLMALGEKKIVTLIENIPTLNVQAEMAARLEAESRKIDSHDLFDMQSFYTAVPYSSRLIAEKACISRAKQAKLDIKYSVQLSSSLEDLLDL